MQGYNRTFQTYRKDINISNVILRHELIEIKNEFYAH